MKYLLRYVLILLLFISVFYCVIICLPVMNRHQLPAPDWLGVIFNWRLRNVGQECYSWHSFTAGSKVTLFLDQIFAVCLQLWKTFNLKFFES